MSRRTLRPAAIPSRAALETFEPRRLLSAINWSNEGSGPGNDTDGFDANFGANAAQARLVVERAIADWKAVILDFKHAGGGNTYNVQISMGELGPTTRGSSSVTNWDFDLVPTQGVMTLDLNAAGAGWYIDPVIADDGEFDSVLGPYSATASSITTNDLYRTVTHELGHLMGFSTQSTLRLSQFLTNLMVDDPVADNATSPGGLWAFNVNGGPIEATFTEADTGHLYEGPAILNRGDIPVHPEDLMNSGRASASPTRKLISDLDATILRDAYGYTVAMPSTLNNMLVNPNFTTDVLSIRGRPDTNDLVSVNSAAGGFSVAVSGFTEFVPLSQVSSIDINTGDRSDQITLNYNAAKPTTVDGGPNTGAGDQLLLNGAATVTLTTVTNAALNTVTYSGLESMILTGSSGNDVFSVKSTSSTTPVTINAGVGVDSLLINPNAGVLTLYDAPVTWNGGDGADTLQFDLQSNTREDQFSVGSSAVTVNRPGGFGTVTVNQVGFDYFSDFVVVNAGSGPDVITLPETNLKGSFSGNGGNDTFNVGGGNVGISYTTATLSGGSGNDSLVLDDSLYNGAASWAINDINVQRNVPGSAQSFSYAGFEGIGIKTGTGGASSNSITTFGAIPVALTITGGNGADNFFINNFANEAAGGPGGPEQLQSLFNGGGGFNQLIVNDSARGVLVYNMYPTRLETIETLADDGEFSFLGIGAMSVTASDSLTTLHVYGTPASIVPGNQTTVLLHGGNDNAYVYPHDAAGNLTVTTAIGIIGEAGTDTFTVQDGGSTGAIGYTISNPFGAGTQSMFGMGTGGLGTATIEQLVVNAGNGADVFNVDQYKSGTGLTLNGGGGDDTLNFGGGNLPANVTSLDSFFFNGQGGFDRFNLNNTLEGSQWQYIREAVTIRSERMAPLFGYLVVLGETGVEEMTVNAGSNGDSFYVRSVSAGASMILNGGAGLDGLVLADSTQNLSGIQGLVRYNAGAAGGNVLVSDNADTTGDIGHLTDSTLGAFAGDTLFGAGGSLEFHDIVNFGASPGITLNCSSGADTIYAQPLATARVTLSGGNPATAPGDTLHLALAGVQNHAITGTPANGSVTSTNRQTLNYVGFETGPNVDATAPIPDVIDVNPDPRYAAVDAIAISFSEIVTGLNLADLSLTRDGGPNLLTGAEPLTTSDNITWTLGNLAALTTVRGAYALTLTAAGSGIVDAYGNALAANASDSWTLTLPLWLTPASAATWNAATGTLTVTGPTTIIADPGVENPLIVASGPAAVLTINPASGSQVNVGGLTLSNGATATVTNSGTDRVLVISAAGGLNVTSGGKLDLTDNDMIVKGATLSGIQGLITGGFGGGTWDGAGVNSSAAATDPNATKALGYGDNAELGLTSFSGVTGLTGNEILVKYTYYGDADLTGVVDLDDYGLFLTGFQNSSLPRTWIYGDFDYTGVIDLDDYGLFLYGYQNQGGLLEELL